MKRTYKIEFEKKYVPDYFCEDCWKEVRSSYLISKIKSFCSENKIRLKKLVIKNCKSTSYVKIKGDKEAYDALILYLTGEEMNRYINLEKVH